MITLIDYGIGNLRSIEKAFEHIGASVHRTDQPDDILSADHLLLPGVGAFGACIGEVQRRELVGPIKEAIQRGVPFLGICVGMQMLFETGQEDGVHPGLKILPGHVQHFSFPTSKHHKVPQIGWNQVLPERTTPLLFGLGSAPWCYFAHSYHAVPKRANDVLAYTTYGVDFPSVVGRGNVFGVQFHPEKSHHSGLRILKNFAELA